MTYLATTQADPLSSRSCPSAPNRTGRSGSAYAGRAVLFHGCAGGLRAQAWDLEDGELAWETSFPDDWPHDLELQLVVQEVLYVGTYEGLSTVALADRKVALLAEGIDPDYELTLLAEVGEMIVARARRTRGSTRYEVWGLDRSADRSWRHEVANDTLLGVDAGSWDWAYRVVPDGVMLLQVLEEPDRLVVETLDLQDGRVIRSRELEVECASVDGIAWTRRDAYVNLLGDLFRLDMDAGDLTPEWP